jgi:hypothetical protein
MLEAQQLDSYGLQFSKPTFISLNPSATVSNLADRRRAHRRQRYRPSHGQVFQPLNAPWVLTTPRRPASRCRRSAASSALEKGVLTTCSSSSFEKIGDQDDTLSAADVRHAPAAADLPPNRDVGLRTFDELNASLSQITGVPQTNARVAATYDLVKQALPAIEKFGTFGPAQQTAWRSSPSSTATRWWTRRTCVPRSSPVASPRPARAVCSVPRVQARAKASSATCSPRARTPACEWDPDDDLIHDELDNLITKLNSGPTGSQSGGAGTVMKATCGAVLGSGTMLFQ